MILQIMLFLSLGAQGSSGYVVGNGGEGYRFGDAVYLRDFVEAGLEDQPFFGDETSARWQAASFPFTFKAPVELLRRKLTSIDRSSGRMARVLALAISQYTWVLVNEPLAQIPDRGRIIDDSPLNRVPVANRFSRTIRIHRDLWDRMPEEHQVGLLIHEAVYGLLKPVCDVQGCYQSPLAAREITGLLFMPPSIAHGENLRAALRDFNWGLDAEDFIRRPLWDLSLFILRTAEFDFEGLQGARLYEASEIAATGAATLRKLCELGASFKGQPGIGVHLRSEILRGPLSLKWTEYNDSYGVQKSLQINASILNSNRMTFRVDVLDANACVSTFDRHRLITEVEPD